MTAKIPEGFATVTPGLNVNDAAKAIDLYVQAFGATELYRMIDDSTGKIMHACLQIGSSKVFISDANPATNCGPTSSNFYLYVPDADAAFAQARKAGLQERMAPQDMFWGDRTGVVTDPFGNNWNLATHVRDVSPQEMDEGRKKFAAAMKGSKAA